MRPITTASFAAFRQAKNPRKPGPYAVGPQPDDRHECQSVKDRLGAWRIEAGPLGGGDQDFAERRENESADDRAEYGAEPANDRREDQLDRSANVEHLGGKQVAVIERVEHAGDRGHAG